MKATLLALCGILFTMALTGCQTAAPKVMKSCEQTPSGIFVCKDL